MTDGIAERTLRYRPASGGDWGTLVVRVLPPFLLTDANAPFPFEPGTAGCAVRVEGLPTAIEEIAYGADTLQALELAISNIEPILRSVAKTNNLFFMDGEPYF